MRNTFDRVVVREIQGGRVTWQNLARDILEDFAETSTTWAERARPPARLRVRRGDRDPLEIAALNRRIRAKYRKDKRQARLMRPAAISYLPCGEVAIATCLYCRKPIVRREGMPHVQTGALTYYAPHPNCWAALKRLRGETRRETSETRP